MSWDPKAFLVLFVVLHGVAALLLLLVDRIRAWRGRDRKPEHRADAGARPSDAPAGPPTSHEWPRAHAEECLVRSLRDWQARAAGGEILPDAAGACRSRQSAPLGSRLMVRG